VMRATETQAAGRKAPELEDRTSFGGRGRLRSRRRRMVVAKQPNARAAAGWGMPVHARATAARPSFH
jgi:hypothetical protein